MTPLLPLSHNLLPCFPLLSLLLPLPPTPCIYIVGFNRFSKSFFFLRLLIIIKVNFFAIQTGLLRLKRERRGGAGEKERGSTVENSRSGFYSFISICGIALINLLVFFVNYYHSKIRRKKFFLVNTHVWLNLKKKKLLRKKRK